ncbi:MAG: DUF881 domain-containing protein, partial [Actinomycetes bacterium]
VDSADGITVGDQVVTPPYRIDAIGPSDTLAAGLSFPGGVLESVRESGANGTVVQRESLQLPALD